MWEEAIGKRGWPTRDQAPPRRERDAELRAWLESNSYSNAAIMKSYQSQKAFAVDKPFVTYARVFAPKMLGSVNVGDSDTNWQGIAVAMYQYAARLLAKQGFALWADSNQTDHARGIWNYMVQHPALPTRDGGVFSNGTKRIKLDYRTLKLTSIRQSSSIEIATLSGNQLVERLEYDLSSLRPLPFMGRARIESDHRYTVAFDRDTPVGLWEWVDISGQVASLNKWRDTQGLARVKGRWYSGWNVSVLPEYRGKGLASTLTNTIIQSMKKGDLFSVSSLEDDGVKFMKKWLPRSNTHVSFMTYYSDLDYNPSKVNVILKRRDKVFWS
tara:strand:- start:13816 stop:14796 length:981 start_codon:yes stop_codon:yes gene_type:complete